MERSGPEAAFTAHRARLVGVAYRLLGSFGDAEDVVQEAWLRWERVDPATVADPEAFLVRTVSRLALDRLRRIAARRETYVGPWLPEPVLTGGRDDPAAEAEQAASVSLAMLVVLETLAPDATLWADGGGKAKAPLRPIHGAPKIARFFAAVGAEALLPGLSVEVVEVNGAPAAVLVGPEGAIAVLQLDLDDDGRATDVRLVGNPDKLTGLAALRSPG